MTTRYEVIDAVAVVTLDRPDKHNALTVEMREALGTAFETAARDAAVPFICESLNRRFGR